MYSTRGIVLDYVKYSESSIIVHIYTSRFGRQSYIINGVRKSKSRGKAVFMQPLTLLQLEVTHKEKKEIHRIVDHKVEYPFFTIPFSQAKRSIVFFITEILSKVLKEEEPNTDLFNFIYESVKVLDGDIPGLNNFHLFFLFKLSRFLGFGISRPVNNSFSFFDLKNSEYLNSEPAHQYFITGESLKYWTLLSEMEASQLQVLKIPLPLKKNIIDSLITYFELHILNFGSVKSLKILQSLFD
ncbi:MAG: DNA repair protein RecO [Chlorobi bacterium]|nr:DNA repair protein RecO [Chlorobiota bacterium]